VRPIPFFASVLLHRRPTAVLVRIVRMTVRPDAADAFLDRFDENASRIRAFPGCRHLELWRDTETPAAFTTLSHWDDADALDAYRESELFTSTWAAVTPLFAARPQAHSYRVIRPAETIDPNAAPPTP
jgi:quinol monooxygenase YgiN